MSFFGIVALGSRKQILAQHGYVCWGRCFCDRRSCETASELFEFYDNISWDVAAGLLLLHKMIKQKQEGEMNPDRFICLEGVESNTVGTVGWI